VVHISRAKDGEWKIQAQIGRGHGIQVKKMGKLHILGGTPPAAAVHTLPNPAAVAGSAASAFLPAEQ
jgi:hypothetical protein